MPFNLISCNIHTSYKGIGNKAKRKSMIVQFVSCDKKRPVGQNDYKGIIG